MLHILGWIIIGLVAGFFAKMVVPGREPGGFLATTAIGMVGAVLGGWIWSALNLPNIGSLLIAFVGAVLLLVLYHAVTNNRSRV